jgi:hypothetical protein
VRACTLTSASTTGVAGPSMQWLHMRCRDTHGDNTGWVDGCHSIALAASGGGLARGGWRMRSPAPGVIGAPGRPPGSDDACRLSALTDHVACHPLCRPRRGDHHRLQWKQVARCKSIEARGVRTQIRTCVLASVARDCDHVAGGSHRRMQNAPLCTTLRRTWYARSSCCRALRRQSTTMPQPSHLGARTQDW